MRLGLALLPLSMLAQPAIAAAPAAVDGLWKTEDGKAMVRIGTCGEGLCGTVAKLLAPPSEGSGFDVRNPDQALRARPLIGMPILTGFKPESGQWRGKIYDPKTGKTYRSILKRENANMLQVQGCVAFFCQTQHWQRAG